MNTVVSCNYAKLKRLIFALPLLLLIIIVTGLYFEKVGSVSQYVYVQKSAFMFINHHLAQYPAWQLNLTQMGNALIFLSFLSIFIVYAPKIWEALISASLVSLVLSKVLKKLFAVPRPAAVFENDSFFILGERLSGRSSFPSGHSITVFAILTVLMFAFMPSNNRYKYLWFVGLASVGLILSLTRVGVGAHYPLDVLVGSILGYIAGLAGIFISQRYAYCDWINNKKWYPFFIVLFSVCTFVLIYKIFQENLPIYYFAMLSLAISLYKITHVYAKKS
jgi:membrane-associated phospholipid phosphatase